MNPATFERSPDTDAVVIALRGANLEISYKSIAQQTGLAIRRVMGILGSARRILEKEKILFGTIRGEGLRRLTDRDLPKLPARHLKRTARSTKRELKRQDCYTNFEALPQTERHTATIGMIALNAILGMATTKTDAPKPKAAPQPMANVADITRLVKKG